MERLRRITADEVMTRNPYVVSEQETLLGAIEIMREHDIRQLPVVDESGRLVGIVTDRDLRQSLSSHLDTELETGQDVLDTYVQVGEIMTGEPLTVLPEDTMDEIIDVLLSTKVGGLPVVNVENVPVGMVSYLDVLTAVRDLFT
ncbi:MAG: CBS domain-containing protein [Nitrospirota bacterium]|jgi:acetoin utilization protein AcuB